MACNVHRTDVPERYVLVCVCVYVCVYKYMHVRVNVCMNIF